LTHLVPQFVVATLAEEQDHECDDDQRR
jgi:hypothetical protein